MLDESFRDVYTKFKLHFYQEVFSRFQNREASLTAVETFCMEIIMALEEPTINEFASFVNISSPNAAYKVNSRIRIAGSIICGPLRNTWIITISAQVTCTP